MLEINLRFADRTDIKELKSLDPEYKLIGKKLQDGVPIVVAVVQGKIAGYLVYDIPPDVYVLEHIFVQPEMRGKYISIVLMMALTSKLKGTIDFDRKTIVTRVLERNTPKGVDKIKYLRKMGFVLLGFEDADALLVYEVPELGVLRIVKSDRNVCQFPEYLPYEVK